MYTLQFYGGARLKMLPANNSDRILISRDNPHSHLGLANLRTRAQHTADFHIHLYIAHSYILKMVKRIKIKGK